jgi:ribosome-associated translation inhibitor RaiA
VLLATDPEVRVQFPVLKTDLYNFHVEIYINYYSSPALHMEATVKDIYGRIMK